jgi:hypothetical protein
MSFVEKLKWFWDPRTDEDKQYAKWDQETPLQRRIQKLDVYIKNRETPFTISYSEEDIKTGSIGALRFASNKDTFDSSLKEWLGNRGSRGITIDSVWYSPESIERIELGEQRLENL